MHIYPADSLLYNLVEEAEMARLWLKGMLRSHLDKLSRIPMQFISLFRRNAMWYHNYAKSLEKKGGTRM